MASMDFYQVLGVNRKATPSEIKKAFKRLARKCHPDLHPGDRGAEDQFKRITQAYEVLSDPAKRRRYDQTGSASQQPGPPPPGSRGFEGGFPPGFGFDTGGFGRGFADIFEEIFNPTGGEARRGPTPGEDRVYPFRIGFFDALRGVNTTLELDRETTCPDCGGAGTLTSSRSRVCPECGGTGKIQRQGGRVRYTSECRRCGGKGRLAEEPCRRCGATGKISQREKVQIRIPAGVDTGSRVRLAGKGGAGTLGGPPGDLYVQIQVEGHPFFTRAGDQILCTVPISFSEAALGARIEVPTLDGPSTIRIPPGTQSGQKLRLRGKGAPSLKGEARGDQIVEVRVVTPELRDERARALLRELGGVDPADLRGHLKAYS